MVDWNTVLEIVKTVIVAGLGGAFYAALGYFKNREGEYFDPEKFLATVLLAYILAAVATLLGFRFPDFDTPEEFQLLLEMLGLFGFLTMAVEFAAKGVVRWIRARLAR